MGLKVMKPQTIVDIITEAVKEGSIFPKFIPAILGIDLNKHSMISHTFLSKEVDRLYLGSYQTLEYDETLKEYNSFYFLIKVKEVWFYIFRINEANQKLIKLMLAGKFVDLPINAKTNILQNSGYFYDESLREGSLILECLWTRSRARTAICETFNVSPTDTPIDILGSVPDDFLLYFEDYVKLNE